MTQSFNLYRAAKLAFIAGLLTVSPNLVRAQSARCTVLRGSYAFTSSGTALLPGTSAPVPFFGVGSFTFDDTGKFVQVSSMNLNGSISRSVPISGTYILKPDCSGTLATVFPDGSNRLADFVVSKRGKTFYAIGVAEFGPGNMITITATRID